MKSTLALSSGQPKTIMCLMASGSESRLSASTLCLDTAPLDLEFREPKGQVNCFSPPPNIQRGNKDRISSIIFPVGEREGGAPRQAISVLMPCGQNVLRAVRLGGGLFLSPCCACRRTPLACALHRSGPAPREPCSALTSLWKALEDTPSLMAEQIS